MTFRTCAYEKEIRQALKDGHWPAGCAPELRDHVENCANCSDLVLVTEAFQIARRSPAPPASSTPDLIWWRAQLRRQRIAAERVSRPITVAQVFAWLITLVAAGGLLAWQYEHGLRWASWLSDISIMRVLRSSALFNASFDWNLVLLIPTLAALALVSGVVVYLVSEKS
jgi:hypothetical protein